jgi:hypothetical protein
MTRLDRSRIAHQAATPGSDLPPRGIANPWQDSINDNLN